MKEKEIIRPFWKCSFLMLIVFLVTTIALNTLFRLNFYNQSLNFIIDIQTHHNLLLDIFMNLLSLLANTHFILVLLIVLYSVCKRKLAVLVYISYFVVNSYLANILKITYQEPRPYWAASEIKKLEWGCPAKYGNPSGHSWMVILIYEPLITDFITTNFNRRYKVLGSVFLVLIGVLIPFSRMYLGSHTGNEIMMGLTLGLIMNAIYRLKIQEILYEFYLDMYHRLSMYAYFQVTIVNLFILTVPLLLFSINSVSPVHTNNSYLYNLNTKCNTDEHTALSIEEASLKAHSIVNLVFGFIFGLASSAKTSYMYYLGQWNYNSSFESSIISKFIIKIILQTIISIPSAVVFSWIVPKLVDNSYINYLSSCLGYWICGYVLVKYGDRVLRACGVIESGGKHNTMIILKEKGNMDQVYGDR